MRSIRLADVANSRDNNFDVLRLFAASIVLVSHSWVLAGGEDPLEPSGLTLGELGVALFFAMSGFLILKSWSFAPRVREFTAKRALRILPALWVALTLTALVLGPIVTDHTLVEYLTAPQTWLYVASGFVLLTFGGRLPGVFGGNPYPDAVNGSLWTLPVEASAYVLVAVLGVLGLLRRPALVPFAFVSMLIASWFVQDWGTLANIRLYAFFLAGMLLYQQRERVVLAWPLAIAALVVWVLSLGSSLSVVASALALPYVVFVFAYRTPAGWRRLVGLGDVSYGLYIYAFPVQQTVAYGLGGRVTFWWILLIAYPITWLLAFVSWRLVERPALRLKPRTRGESRSLNDPSGLDVPTPDMPGAQPPDGPLARSR